MKKLSKVLLTCFLALGTGAFALNSFLTKDKETHVVHALSPIELNNLYYYNGISDYTFESRMPTGFSFDDGTLTVSDGAETIYEIWATSDGSLTLDFETNYGGNNFDVSIKDGNLVFTSSTNANVSIAGCYCKGTLDVRGNINLTITGPQYSYDMDGKFSKSLVGCNDLYLYNNASILAIDPNLHGKTISGTSFEAIFAINGFFGINTTGCFKAGLYSTPKSDDETYALEFLGSYSCLNLSRCDGGLILYTNSNHQYIYGTYDLLEINQKYICVDEDNSLTIRLCLVSYDANGGSGTMDTYGYIKGNYSLDNCEFIAPTGQQFKCWAENSPSGTQYNAGANYSITDDVTFYAIWEDSAPTEYIVHYSAGEGEGGGDLDYVVAGTQIILASPENVSCYPLSGKVFDAWLISGSRYNVGDSYIVNADTYITALWKDAPIPALTGTVTVTGITKFGETLTASVTDTNNTGTLSYQWKRDDADISGATSQTYLLLQEDIGKFLACLVTSSVQTGSIISNQTSVVTKADGPSAPTGLTSTSCTTLDNNNGTISGLTTDMEYKYEDGDWLNCDAAILNDLTPGNYYVRYKETATHCAGEMAVIVINGYDGPASYSITVNYGVANVSSAQEGTTIVITANEPASGYEFDRWVSDDVTFIDATSESTSFVMPNKNVVITATYKEITPDPVVLDSITLSGTCPTTFDVGDTFSYEGLVVTAHYSDLTSAVVTGFTVNSPDMSTAGTKTVTVSYTEGGVTKTATYQITVKEKSVVPPVDPETPGQPSKGLPAGAIVGIVIGSVLVAGIGVFALVWFVIKKKTWADFVALFKKK